MLLYLSTQSCGELITSLVGASEELLLVLVVDVDGADGLSEGFSWGSSLLEGVSLASFCGLGAFSAGGWKAGLCSNILSIM